MIYLHIHLYIYCTYCMHIIMLRFHTLYPRSICILYGCTLHLVFHKKTSGSLWSKSPFMHSLFHVSNAKMFFLALYHQSWCKNYTVFEVLRPINIIAKIDYTVYISLKFVLKFVFTILREGYIVSKSPKKFWNFFSACAFFREDNTRGWWGS